MGPVTIMVVAAPAGAKRGIHLQDSINNSQGVFHKWIVWFANAVPHQLEKTRIHDVLCRELRWLPGRTIVNDEESVIGILIGRNIADRSGMNANIVAFNPS